MMEYLLQHDGVTVFEGTENQCLMYLHKSQGQSWDYAFKYGGYKLVPKEPAQPNTIDLTKENIVLIGLEYVDEQWVAKVHFDNHTLIMTQDQLDRLRE